MSMPLDLSLKLVNEHGAIPASRVPHLKDRVVALPFEFALPRTKLEGVRMGIFAHIFYTDLSAEIRQSLRNIPVDFDLFISTDSAEKRKEIRPHFESFGPEHCEIRVFPTRGRDIAPFLVGYNEEIRRYDIIGRLHSKKSAFDSRYAGWRQYLFRQLFGSPAVVSSIIYALQSGEVDLLFADHYAPVIESLNYGHNFNNMKAVLERLGVTFSKDIILDFPSGSMFWARTKILEPLLNLGLRFEDFSQNDATGHADGTLAHSIERLLVYLTEVTGGRWAKVVQPADCRHESRLVPVCSPEDVSLAITRSSRRLLGNRVSINLQPRAIPEIPSAGFRGEKSLRPRFTLLIPTLKPQKIFGGVASALRLFNQVLAELPSEVDARIVSTSDNVDADCVRGMSGYTLIPLGAENTELPRTIVDASGIRAEQLPIRSREAFLGTAWWTAYFGFEAREMQKLLYGAAPPLYYFIQDHEPDFYGWSSRYALARSTYLRKEETKAIINSEELYNFFAQDYGFDDACYVPYTVNEQLRSNFRAVPKERIILVYARPSTPRNAFEILVDGLCLWQQANPTIARSWRIVAVGENFEPWRAEHVSNIEIVGKLSLEDYADILCRAAVGVSLMISPHPSYPPLEMAEAGLITITNTYGQKKLQLRADNIHTLDVLTPASLATQIVSAVALAESSIGHSARFREIISVPCNGTVYSPANVARLINCGFGLRNAEVFEG